MFSKLANNAFLLLDKWKLCPHAIVERSLDFLGLENNERCQFLYDWGLNLCTQVCMKLPPDDHDDQ